MCSEMKMAWMSKWWSFLDKKAHIKQVLCFVWDGSYWWLQAYQNSDSYKYIYIYIWIWMTG